MKLGLLRNQKNHFKEKLQTQLRRLDLVLALRQMDRCYRLFLKIEVQRQAQGKSTGVLHTGFAYRLHFGVKTGGVVSEVLGKHHCRGNRCTHPMWYSSTRCRVGGQRGAKTPHQAVLSEFECGQSSRPHDLSCV